MVSGNKNICDLDQLQTLLLRVTNVRLLENGLDGDENDLEYAKHLSKLLKSQ